ncbi:MAG: hypothetical protein RLZZ341_2526, partial [Pseudomonadota bacterium]
GEQRAAQPGAAEVGVAGRARRGPDRAVGRRRRAGGAGPAGRRGRARRAAGAAAGRAVPGPLLHRAAARRPAHQRGPRARRRAAGRAAAAAGGGHAPGAVPRGRRLRRPRGARVHRRGRDAGQPAARQALHARAALPDAGADARAIRRPAQRHRAHRGHRAALQPHAGAGQAAAAGLPHARGRRCAAAAGGLLPPGQPRGPGAAPGRPVPRPRAPAGRAAALRGAAGVRAVHHREDGLPGLLPHRLGLHRLGQGARLPGGPGPRLGRGLAGGLRPLHHRPRPAAVPAAVRALPEPRARVDARLRHRLLPGQPRPRDRVREGSRTSTAARP